MTLIEVEEALHPVRYMPLHGVGTSSIQKAVPLDQLDRCLPASRLGLMGLIRWRWEAFHTDRILRMRVKVSIERPED